jgi:predicted acetyltransferase
MASFVHGEPWVDQFSAKTQNSMQAIAARLKRFETMDVAVGFMRVINEVQLACKIDRHVNTFCILWRF